MGAPLRVGMKVHQYKARDWHGVVVQLHRWSREIDLRYPGGALERVAAETFTPVE